MSGTQIFVVALVAVVGALLLMFVAQRNRTPGLLKLGLGDAFNLELSLGSDDKDRAAKAAGDAGERIGLPGAEVASQVRGQVKDLQQVRLTRVLWVDDSPDNNVFEVVALTSLGIVITTASSNRAARTYLDAFSFDLVITDIGRGGDADDGGVLLRELRHSRPTLPVVVYTMRADEQRRALMADGARAVEDRPDGLIGAVLKHAASMVPVL